MDLQKGERCCGEEEGICWNNLCLSACVNSYQHLKQPRGGMGRRTCSEAKKNEALCYPTESLGSQGKNEALEGRSTGDIHSQGNTPLCPTILGSSWGEWRVGHRDARMQAARLWVASWVLGCCTPRASHEASKRSHLFRGKVNIRDD